MKTVRKHHRRQPSFHAKRAIAATMALLMTLPLTALIPLSAVKQATDTPPFVQGSIPTSGAHTFSIEKNTSSESETSQGIFEDELPLFFDEETPQLGFSDALNGIGEAPDNEILPEEDASHLTDGEITQEVIALSFADAINTRARSGTKIYYPYPSGAMAVDLYLNGSRVLRGQVADIGGVVYVPVQRFADMFGSFTTTYEADLERVTIKGKNLSVSVMVGDPYITVNERIFYTGHKVLSLGGWIFVPITSMAKAMGADVTIKKGYYEAYVTSGDPTSIPWASQYYNETDLYWLSRIISAEAKGEPFSGQIAVGNVVLNRVRSASFPNTVKGVIFDTKYGTQFSPISNGTIYNTPTASAVMAAKVCLEGYTLSSRMLYFFNPSISSSSWISRTRPYIMTIGNHKFYG